jgi:tight adherence protein B
MALVPAAVLTVALLAAALCGALVLPAVLRQGVQMLRRSRLQTRLIDGEAAEAAFPVGLLRRGVPALRPLARLLLRIRWFHAKCHACRRALEIKGSEAHAIPCGTASDRGAERPVGCSADSPAGRPRASGDLADLAVCESLLVALAVLALIVLVLTGMPLTALCAVVLAAALLFGRAQKALERWEGRLVEQIPDALRSLGICFNAGYSLQQAFEQVAQDSSDPLASELTQVSFDIRAGRGVEEALSALEGRTRAADLRFALVSLEIQHRTGGGLQELLENAADAVCASADLRRQLGVQTAQARLSARIVVILPLVLVAVLSMAMEGYLQSFFSSTQGLTILFVALGMEVLGVCAIRRILGVDLG